MAYEPDKDPNYLEWKDAREATAKLDSMLIDLRKYGFTLITGLTTASSFLGFSTPNYNLLQNVVMVTMGLIVILYWLDIYYQNLLYGAVIRTLFLELFKLKDGGKRGLANFITSLHSYSGIRYFLHGIYYGFLVALFSLGLFVANLPTSQDEDKNSTIEIKVPKDASLTIGNARLTPTGTNLAKNSESNGQQIPFSAEVYGAKIPIILIITFAISLIGMLVILGASDLKREKKWKCICNYMRKKQKETNPNADLIENTIYFVFADMKDSNIHQSRAYNSELKDCDCA